MRFLTMFILALAALILTTVLWSTWNPRMRQWCRVGLILVAGFGLGFILGWIY